MGKTTSRAGVRWSDREKKSSSYSETSNGTSGSLRRSRDRVAPLLSRSCRHPLSAVCGRRCRVRLLGLFRRLERRGRERRFEHVRRTRRRGRESLHAISIPVQCDLLLPGRSRTPRQWSRTSEADTGAERWEEPPLAVLEIPSVLLVDQDQVEVIPSRELLVHVPERRREFKPAEEEADRNRLACPEQTPSAFLSIPRGVKMARLTSHGCTIHDLKLGDGLAFVVLIWCCDVEGGWSDGKVTTHGAGGQPRSGNTVGLTGSRRLSSDDTQLHVFDLDPNQEEVDLADDDILQVIPARRGDDGQGVRSTSRSPSVT